MEDNRTDEIIDDLLKLRPVGLATEIIEYEDYTEFCYKAYKDKKRTRCNHPHWGYDPDTLFSLGFHRQSDVEDYVCRRFYDVAHKHMLKRGQKSGLSRKTNRIWSRISAAISEVQTEGREGIYTVCRRWSSDIYATVWASNHDDAMLMAKMFYGHVLPEGNEFKTIFKRLGTSDEVIPVNVSAVKALRESIEVTLKRIERYQTQIVDETARIEAIQMMQNHILSSAESRAE